jgi:hypothetical protein
MFCNTRMFCSVDVLQVCLNSGLLTCEVNLSVGFSHSAAFSVGAFAVHECYYCHVMLIISYLLVVVRDNFSKDYILKILYIIACVLSISAHSSQ